MRLKEETGKKIDKWFSQMRFRDEINNSPELLRFNQGKGKTSYMLKNFQEMKKYYKIDKTDEEFLNELKNDGFVIVKPCSNR